MSPLGLPNPESRALEKWRETRVPGRETLECSDTQTVCIHTIFQDRRSQGGLRMGSLQ
jgi:hypothetical protein